MFVSTVVIAILLTASHGVVNGAVLHPPLNRMFFFGLLFSKSLSS